MLRDPHLIVFSDLSGGFGEAVVERGSQLVFQHGVELRAFGLAGTKQL